MSRFFPITSVCKDDILHHFKDHDQFEAIKKRVRELTTLEMAELARDLADDYCDQLFWTSLEVIFLTKYFRVEA